MPNKTYRYTTDRGRGKFERTVVGKTGQTHVDKTDKQGKDGHFTDEGGYRRAIEESVRQNSD